MGLTMLLGCELVLEEHLRLGIASLAMQSLHGNVIMRPGHILYTHVVLESSGAGIDANKAKYIRRTLQSCYEKRACSLRR